MFAPTGQGWLQLGELLLAFVLSALVGLEREVKQKSAGLRTYTLVGVSACLFMLISKYGFTNVLDPGRVVLDPSRVAAQIVSGLGFIGGGVIFMRRDVVRGLTTAASVWLTAALGMACGAGLPLLALATTVIHFAVMLGFPYLADRLPRDRRIVTNLRVIFRQGGAALEAIMTACTRARFVIHQLEIEDRTAVAEAAEDAGDAEGAAPEDARLPPGTAAVRLQIKGKQPIATLLARLGAIDGVHHVAIASQDAELE